MTIKVLAMDDEYDVRHLLEIKLKKAGFDVYTAASGDEGMEKALEIRPDIVLADVMMPGRNGFEVVEAIRQELGEESPICIFLTARGLDEDVIKGLSLGAEDYIVKPFSPKKLVERIRIALIKSGKFNPQQEGH